MSRYSQPALLLLNLKAAPFCDGGYSV
jgi:hypothetical protein